ncbi:hypothetical protein EDD11_009671 [Mortierella claussenii]|nr:hypothetical protein EDD11_009671 [Mortierella claussenii]
MKFSACLAVLGATASFASAFVNPLEPWGASVWVPGTQVNITWDDDKVAPLLSTNPVVDIFLNTGGDQTNLKIATVATGVNVGKTNSYLYTVPNVSPPGKIYFLTFVGTGGSPGMAWSTRFTITDAAKNAGTLAPSAPIGSNSGAIGATVTAPVYLTAPTGGVTTAPATATGSVTASASVTRSATGTAVPTATAAGKNGAASVSASALSAAAAVVVGAAALLL